MDAAEVKSTLGVGLRDVFLRGAEPPPVDITARQGIRGSSSASPASAHSSDRSTRASFS